MLRGFASGSFNNLVPFGKWRHARGREECRGEPGGALSGGYAPDSADRRRARGALNPCVQESKALTRRFLREKLISDHGLFSSYEGRQEAAYQNI